MTPPQRASEPGAREDGTLSPPGHAHATAADTPAPVPTGSHLPRNPVLARLNGQDAAVAAAGLVLGAGILYFAGNIPLGPEGPTLGPRWWPRVLAGFMLLSAAVLAFSALRAPSPASQDEEPINRRGFLHFLSVSTLLPVYGIAWLNLDFRVCTPLFLAAVLAVLGVRNWRALILFPIVLTALMYLVFSLGLGVAL